jgi:uncharacterized peroxidase-related enzyme
MAEAKALDNAFYRALARVPQALENFGPLYKTIMGPGTVERRVKELLYLASSFANECAFCSAAHRALGKRAGITDEEIEALQTEQDHLFSAPEKAAIQYARELTRTADVEDARAAVREHFTEDQIVEMTLVVAMSNFTNRFNNALEIMP